MDFKEQNEYNRLIARALEIAAKAHEEGYRKGRTAVPYIVHPFEVALILEENGMDNEIIAAALLHDTLEDTDLTEADIKEEFGEGILDLVLGASERLENREERPWEERKEHTINFLKNAPREIKYISCADKLSNIWSMIRDYQKIGDELWSRFNRGYDKQKWYYQGIVKSLTELSGLKMYEELKQAVRVLFGEETDRPF